MTRSRLRPVRTLGRAPFDPRVKVSLVVLRWDPIIAAAIAVFAADHP